VRPRGDAKGWSCAESVCEGEFGSAWIAREVPRTGPRHRNTRSDLERATHTERRVKTLLASDRTLRTYRTLQQS
jgi:hypothetical protein